jgi:hypothetical protein
MLDLSASTVPIPTSGTMTLRLIDSRNNKLIASQVFAWVGTQGRIRPKNPDAINEWAYRNLGTADTLQYELTKFYSAYGPGLQRIAATSAYDGVVISEFSSTFYSNAPCTTYPSPHTCAPN